MFLWKFSLRKIPVSMLLYNKGANFRSLYVYVYVLNLKILPISEKKKTLNLKTPNTIYLIFV